MTTPATIVRIAPGMRTMLLRSAISFAAFAVVFLVLGLLWHPFRLFGFVAVPLAAGYALYVAGYVRRARIEFGDGVFRVREAATDVRFTVADVEVVVPVDELAIPGQTSPALIVIGASPRRRLIEINGASFGTPALESLASELKDRGARFDHIVGRVTPAEFERRHPRILGLTARHPVGVQVAAVVALVVLAVVSALVGEWATLTA